MKTIGIVNQKGGTGKTTTARETAAALAARGCRTVAIDLDGQADLTGFLLDDATPKATISDVISGVPALQAVTTTGRDRLDLLAADARAFTLASDDVMASAARAMTTQLARRYEFAVIDFPRAASRLSVAFLAACDVAVVPTEPSRASVTKAMGALRILGLMEDPPRAAVLLTRFNARTRIAREYEEIVAEATAERGATLFRARIPTATAVPEAEGYGETVTERSPKSRPALAYAEYMDELLGLLGNAKG